MARKPDNNPGRQLAWRISAIAMKAYEDRAPGSDGVAEVVTAMLSIPEIKQGAANESRSQD